MSDKPVEAVPENHSVWQYFAYKQEAVLGLSGIILGQAVLFAELRPFVLAWLAAALLKGHSHGLAVFCGMAIGLLSKGFGGEYVSNILVASFMVLAFWHGDFWRNKHWALVPLLAVGCNVFFKELFYFLPMVYGYTPLSIIAESLMIGGLIVISKICLDSGDRLWRLEPLQPGEQASWLFIMLAFLLGLDGWFVAGLDLQSICARVLVLAAAYLSGGSGGAMLGILVGLIPSLLGGVTASGMGFYGLAGLVGGLCRSVGKSAVWGGFLAGNLLLMLYFSQGSFILLTVLETLLAGLVFAVLPLEHRVLLPEAALCRKEIAAEDIGRDKMEKIGKIFEELSAELCAVNPEDQQEQVLDSLEGMYKRVYIQICSSCDKWQLCWERDCRQTYQAFCEACDYLEMQGAGRGACFSKNFKVKCQRTAELEVALLNQIDLIKQKKYYQEQVASAKETVARQLAGIGQMVNGLAHTSDYAKTAEKRLWQNAGREHMPLEKVRVYENEQHDWEIALQLKRCQGDKYCQQILPMKISKWLKRSYRLVDNACPVGEGQSCQMKLTPVQSWQVISGVAVATKSGNKVSGDSWAELKLAPGKTILILSDGMGAGIEANRQSTTTVKLLQRLLAGGMTDQLALEIVNAVLLLRSDQESFATVDLVLLDTISKTAEMVKISAAPSFIKHQGQVRTFQSCSLPVGILNEVDIARQTHPLSAGDLLVMMSDGVYETYGNDEKQWQTIIAELPSDEPQLAAEYLLAIAGSHNEQAVDDDMTVIVARIALIN